MKHTLKLTLLAASLIATSIRAMPPEAVVWESPSKNSLGSMPIGNGDIGANVWVEPSGDIVLLLSKTDAYDEFNRLLKVGRIRIKTAPALVADGQPFRQTLSLQDGAIGIQGNTTTARVWVDANHPVVQVDVQSSMAVTAEAHVELWRTAPRMLNRVAGREKESHSASYNRPEDNRVNPDTVLPHADGELAWCHHNVSSVWEANLELTALGDQVEKGSDPLLHRTFGALVRGPGFVAESDTVMKTAQPAKALSIQVFPLTGITASPDIWRQAAAAQADAIPANEETRFAAHQAWWHSFWDRSWVNITGGAMRMPINAHPWRVGVDSQGRNRFRGTISDAQLMGRALTPEEVTHLAAGPRTGDKAGPKEVDYTQGITLAAWINPASGEQGRILDKCTAGVPDGITFDSVPGLALRLIVGRRTMIQTGCLKAGQWHHVAATADASTGIRRLYRDGKLVKEEQGDSDAALVTQAYALQRYVSACAGRGALPIKFNGSIFTVDQVFDPDYRRWGGAYWFQNTRLPYWALLYSGDYDMMQPLFRMYMKALPLRKAATRKYYNHDGAFFPETMQFWGNFTDGNYGINRKGKPDGLTDNTYIRRYWQGGLELVCMMLDYYDHTQDAKFRDQTLLPMATEIMTFFDQHWKRGTDGKILYSPAQSLETWHVATDPLPEIVAVRYLVPRLLGLPASETVKAVWRKQLADQPVLPSITQNGKTRLLPAKTYSKRSNAENPELYAVFPYRAYTLAQGGEALEIGINTWNSRRNRANVGWQQQPIQSALLGLTDQAQGLVVQRARDKARGYRFPGFYGPNYDWTPDQDQISVFQIGLQRMLMQCDLPSPQGSGVTGGNSILLLPAWPREWNVSFKLHAPLNTTVEGVYRDGKMQELKVTPESRRKDVILQLQPTTKD